MFIPRDKPRLAKSAFTLLELILGLLLGLLMLTIAIPSVSGLVEEREMEREYRDLSQALENLSRECRQTGLPARLEIREDGLFAVKADEEELLLLPLSRKRQAAFVADRGNRLEALDEPLYFGRHGHNFPVVLEITGERPWKAKLGPLNGSLILTARGAP